MGAASTHLDFLRHKIDGTLSDLINSAERPAMVEFPAYPNVGDSAIWVGQVDYLSERYRRRPAVTTDLHSYSKEVLGAIRGLDTILITGGGGLGDIWKGTLDGKIRVLQDFPHTRVIQLPQTIHFIDPARLEDYRRAVARHPNFTLLVRDQPSFDLATKVLDCEVRLCPDMALWLRLSRTIKPTREIVCLLRTDIEASGRNYQGKKIAVDDIHVFDWLEEKAAFLIQAERRLTDTVVHHPRKLATLQPILSRVRDHVARDRLRRGCGLLSAGKVVVTDRLHGHILCVLMGIPHVILDNSYGKVSSFHKSWTKNVDTAHFATSMDEALDVARQLAAEAR